MKTIPCRAPRKARITYIEILVALKHLRLFLKELESLLSKLFEQALQILFLMICFLAAVLLLVSLLKRLF